MENKKLFIKFNLDFLSFFDVKGGFLQTFKNILIFKVPVIWKYKTLPWNRTPKTVCVRFKNRKKCYITPPYCTCTIHYKICIIIIMYYSKMRTESSPYTGTCRKKPADWSDLSVFYFRQGVRRVKRNTLPYTQCIIQYMYILM